MDRRTISRAPSADSLSPDTMWIMGFSDADSVEGSAQLMQLLHSLQAANLKVQEYRLKKRESAQDKGFWSRFCSFNSHGGNDRNVEYVITISSSNLRMEEEAERTGLLKKLRGNAGLFPFSRAHRHLFGLRVLQDKLISVSERLRLIHHIMLASHESNGAALDIAALFEWKLVSLLPVRSVTQAQALIDSCCSFWPFKWDSLPLDAIKDFFGADVATFFFFQQHLTRCSYLLAVLSCIVFAFRYELNRAPFAEALWCCIVLAACSVTITTWQTRLEETLYFWGMSIKFPGIGCVARKKEIGEGTVLSITNPDILMAFNRKYFSICLVLLIAVASSTCISVVVALAIRNQCTNVRSQELFDDRRVVSFAVAETVRAIAFKFLAHYPFRALSAWQQSSSVDMPALPSYDTTIVCDILFFVFHLLNLLAIPFYLVFFVAVDPAITTLAQRTYCLRNDCMNDLTYYCIFMSIVHVIVNILEMGYSRIFVSLQRSILSIKSRWSKLQADGLSTQARVLTMQSNLPTSYSPPEGISTEYRECILMLSWGTLFASAFPLVSVVLTIAFLMRCRLLLHCMLVSRTHLSPHYTDSSSHWMKVLKFIIVSAVFTNATILAFVSKNAEYNSTDNGLAFADDIQWKIFVGAILLLVLFHFIVSFVIGRLPTSNMLFGMSVELAEKQALGVLLSMDELKERAQIKQSYDAREQSLLLNIPKREAQRASGIFASV